MSDRTPYQQQIIKNYYKNKDQIMVQKLSDLVTNLYLAEGKQRAKHWKNAEKAMTNLGIPKSRIEHLVKQDNPELLAKLVEELLAK